MHTWTSTDSTRLSADRLESVQDDRASKRRRLSSLSSVDLSCFMPSFLGNTHQACPSPPASSQSHDSSSTAALDQAAPDSSTFDLDFFHSSFVDFINAGGEGSGPQGWAPGTSESSVPVLVPAASGDLSCLSSAMANSDAQTIEPPAPTTTPPPAVSAPATAPATVDDDTSVDKTIEDWLAEPSKAAPPTAAETPGTVPEPALAAAEPAPAPPRGNLTHATADGTPVCRDPYVLSLETELGLDFGLGPDPPTTTTTTTTATGPATTAPTSSKAPLHSEGDAAMAAIEAIDWFSNPTPAASSQQQAQPPSQPPSRSGSVSGTVVPPMTPVTLDELVQSVEEAVGSARARARARAAAAATGAGAATVSASAGAAGSAGSPVVRNRELDFLTL